VTENKSAIRSWKLVEASRPNISFPLGIVFIALAGSLFGLSFRPHAAFFTAAAQVFPVLLVAFFVEHATELRNFRAYGARLRARLELEEDVNRLDKFEEALNSLTLLKFRLGSAVIWPLALGEVAALWALATRPSAFLFGVCILSLGFAGLALIGRFRERVRPGRDND
jgi:hypothetical protein